jgi:hypothetical protein
MQLSQLEKESLTPLTAPPISRWTSRAAEDAAGMMRRGVFVLGGCISLYLCGLCCPQRGAKPKYGVWFKASVALFHSQSVRRSVLGAVSHAHRMRRRYAQVGGWSPEAVLAGAQRNCESQSGAQRDRVRR